jgi:hypothetical protein
MDVPKAVGLVRTPISGLAAPQHAVEIRRHADRLGYCYVYTVRPPADHDDPVGYALGIAAGLDAAAVVVYDLSTVDNTPSRVCDLCDLETVVPPQTWAVSQPVDGVHSHPHGPLTVPEAHRITQQHIECPAVLCARKAAAVSCLVRAGKLVPPVDTPRERAAARGLPFPPADREVLVRVGADARTLRDVWRLTC